MEIKEVLQKLREIKSVSFATVDKDNKPQVRIIDIMHVEDEKIYFVTSRGKEFHKELERDGNVAIVGLSKNWESIIVNGKAEKSDNQKEWIDKIFDLNETLNDIYPGNSRYILDAFVIENAKVEYFDLSQKPIYRKTFTIGNEKIKELNFFITDKCIECGTCKRICPQQCIKSGTPYKISNENCLHCGLCFEKCPVKAIERVEK